MRNFSGNRRTAIAGATTLLFVITAIVLGTVITVGAASPAAPSILSIAKQVQPAKVAPGSVVMYDVTLANTSASDVTISAISDTLPANFMFVGMAAGSDVSSNPTDDVEPEIGWTGPFTVPASSNLLLRYYVLVPSSVPSRAEPYLNTVRAFPSSGGEVSAIAGLHVAVPVLSLGKEASDAKVISTNPLTYTVRITNTGFADGVVDIVTDTLPNGVTFDAITSGSDIAATPDGTAGEIHWTGPFTVAAQSAQTLSYRVQTPNETEDITETNQVWIQSGSTILGPAATSVTVGPKRYFAYFPMLVRRWGLPDFFLHKSVNPPLASRGSIITYTVDIENQGSEAGALSRITDSLPSGFTFDSIVPGGDITTAPLISGNDLIWSGTFPVPGSGHSTFSYRVQSAGTAGTYTNTVTALAAPPEYAVHPASAVVTLRTDKLLQEDFETGAPNWVPFLNYWRLHPEQWFWDSEDGVNGGGAYTTHAWFGASSPDKGAEDGVAMYLGPGAQQWTDYRYEVKANVRARDGDGTIGVWFRGQYEERDDGSGQWLTGYYLVMGGNPTRNSWFVRLTQMQIPGDCTGAACSNPGNLYDFSNPMELDFTRFTGTFQDNHWYDIVIEVRGAHIQAWVDGVLAIDYVDEDLPFLQGTVGFKSYKLHPASWDEVVVTPLN
ncbi:MAG: DUF11 domain-containing protein [Chloroflexi bacterium]|nr:DUF11 domain-containing protein [Chloroflexota bacterium]